MNLHQAIEKYNTDEVIKLINEVTNINGIDGYRRTPLHIAVRKNNTEIVELLLNKGANVDAVDIFGHTSLHYAST